MSPLFLAVIEATEEAIYNSLFRAVTMTGRGRTIEALPIDRTIEILRKHGAITNDLAPFRSDPVALSLRSIATLRALHFG
jgi:hypothetical protein